MEKACFVAVEFVDDPNVVGYAYWYLCPFEEVKEDDEVIAPLGRHDREQTGVVRKVLFTEEQNAPFPMTYIKKIRKIV